MTKFFKFIFNNLGPKIICVFLALALWIYVGMGQTKNTNFPGGIPLEIRNVPSGLVAVTDTNTVNIKIIADNNVFSQLSFDSFSAFLDMTGLSTGTYEINPTVVSHVANVSVVQVDPDKVVVRLETKVSKTVAVDCLYEGKVADGMAPSKCVANPANVTVAGAKSVIGGLTQATAKMTLQGEATDFTKTVKLLGIDSNGKEIKNITFSPAEASIKVPIVKASTIKTVGIKVNITGLPAEGYWISQIVSDPSTVTITAAENLIGSISFVSTNPVDVTGLNKNKVVQTTLKPDSGVIVMDKIAMVTVTLTVSKNQSAREIEVGFKWVNLADNLKVASDGVNPSSVKVVVVGPQDQLSRLSAGDISLVVDLSGLSDPGTHSVDISRSNIAGPTGVSISSIVPSAINVRLDTK